MIPFKAMINLRIGQFQMRAAPWVKQYARFNFLAITFNAGGGQRTVCLAPIPSGPASLALINAHVAEWFEAVRNAVAATTGTAPFASEPGAITICARPAWNRKGMPLMLAPIVAWLVGIMSIHSANGSLLALPGVAWVLTLLFCLALGWFTFGFIKANQALKAGDFDAVTVDEPPDITDTDGEALSQNPDKFQGFRKKRPFLWTVSAWVFIAIGIVAVIDTLATLYSRPLNFTFYPGLVHVIAGIALLTLNRHWRTVALAGLWLAFLAGAFIGVMMAVSPQNGSVSLPMLNFSVRAIERPYLAAASRCVPDRHNGMALLPAGLRARQSAVWHRLEK